MNSIARRQSFAETLDQLFEPIKFETLADLFAEYQADHEKMEAIAAFFDGSNADLVHFFVKGNSDGSHVSTERLFARERGIKALDASYWQRALALTDVLEAMPQKRRDEWNEQISQLDTPPFDKTTVLSTLQNLLAQRHRFFAERVDGIFQSLSREHVTNRPEGFSKRMILNYVYNGGIADYSRCGTINDLRCVLARFMGRDEPRYYTASRAVEYARRERCGKWVPLDGGALRIRLYKKGTAHLEVHPEMAWRLNAVLASIYPNAIPDTHRTRPRRAPPREFRLYSRPLPVPVLELLQDGYRKDRLFRFDYRASDSPAALREARMVLETLGGVPSTDGNWTFDYPIRPVLLEVVVSGMIPDQRAHQFYPTPRDLAERVIAAAEIGEGHTVLEPSAGHGALAELLPRDATLVEAAPLHCDILRAKGFGSVVEADFLHWRPGRRFDRIVMNPPFTKQQWRRHLEHASDLLAAGGRLVAVLPASARSHPDLLPGCRRVWSDPTAFPGTSIEVVVLTAERG